MTAVEEEVSQVDENKEVPKDEDSVPFSSAASYSRETAKTNSLVEDSIEAEQNRILLFNEPKTDESSPLSSALSSPIFPASPLQLPSSPDGTRCRSLRNNSLSPVSASMSRRSSSSSLSSCPSSRIRLCSVPTTLPSQTLATSEQVQSTKPDEDNLSSTKARAKSRRKHLVSKTSPYFMLSSSSKPKTRNSVSVIPFPPLSSPRFGLVQESLASNPFHLLLATIFLNKTRGLVAMPFFYRFITDYPRPDVLACATREEVITYFQHLGLQNQRARKCIELAKVWAENPPVKGKRYRRLHYPIKGDGKDINPTDGPIDDADQRVAWEIGHLVGVGPYAIDSWRIFCRDALRGLPDGLPSMDELLLDSSVRSAEMAKEWTRVLPGDKELRAYLRWRWARLGWKWDIETGEKTLMTEVEMEVMKGGGMICTMSGNGKGEENWRVLGEGGDLGG